ncbi:uncharacterized protein [Typha angustifolia]|uniref:uncharacterized protein n=1 Tax=Typha angustifolia TaxID=59011 RepID=UPI003C2C7299
MFDSLLGSKFSNKCKHAIKCIKVRLDPIRRKKQAMLRFLKEDVAKLLTKGLDANAFGRIEALTVEINHASCYDMIEEYCEHILKQLQFLNKQRECPQEAMEALSTLIFAAARFPDLPELCDLRHVFTQRYGSHMESFVNAEFVEKLQKKSFSNEKKLQVMQNIAQEFEIRFDCRAFQQKLLGQPEIKLDKPKKDSPFAGGNKEPSSKLPRGYHGDIPSEGKRRSHPVGILQKQEVQEEPKDIHVISNVNIIHQHEKNRKGTADKLEHMDSSYPKPRDSHKETENPIPSRNRVPKIREGSDHTDQEKQEVGSMRYSEDRFSKMAPPYMKHTGAKNEGHIEKENDKTLAYDRLQAAADVPDFKKKSKAPEGLDPVGLEKQRVCSTKSFSEKTIDMVPPYTGQKGTIREYEEEEKGNTFYDRSRSAADLEPAVQDRRPVRQVNYERAVNMIPPYVKPKFAAKPVQEDSNIQIIPGYDKSPGTDHKETMKDALVDDERPRPTSVRRKFAKPPIIDTDNSPIDDEKIVIQTPSGRRRHTSRHTGATYDDDIDVNVVNMHPQPKDNRMVNATDYGSLSHQTPRDKRRHRNRGNGSIYDDDYDAKVPGMHPQPMENNKEDYGKFLHQTPNGQRSYASRLNGDTYDDNHNDKKVMDRYPQPVDDEMDNAIDYGKLLHRTHRGQRRHGSRRTVSYDGDCDEEEKMMDKLLMHYSRKGPDSEDVRMRIKTRRPPVHHVSDGSIIEEDHDDGKVRSRVKDSARTPKRSVSFPAEPVSPAVAKVAAWTNSMHPDQFNGGSVHPRMPPNYDELAARISAMRKA